MTFHDILEEAILYEDGDTDVFVRFLKDKMNSFPGKGLMLELINYLCDSESDYEYLSTISGILDLRYGSENHILIHSENFQTSFGSLPENYEIVIRRKDDKKPEF